MFRRHFADILLIFSIALFLALPLYAAQSAFLDEPLKNLSSDVAHASKKFHCPHSSCTFLVTNFVGDSGDTSKFAVRMADVLSEQLSQTKSANIVDRATFQKFLQSERLPARVQAEESVARWLARKFAADIAIVGKVAANSSGDGRLFITLLEPDEKKGKAIPLSTAFHASIGEADLATSDGLEHLGRGPSSDSGETVYAPGRQGVSLPHCFYMPNPSYTDPARDVKFNGVILVDGYISATGEVRVQRIVRGAPYGLNDSAREAISTWKCDPAQLDGKPVPVIVPFEISFRLY